MNGGFCTRSRNLFRPRGASSTLLFQAVKPTNQLGLLDTWYRTSFMACHGFNLRKQSGGTWTCLASVIYYMYFVAVFSKPFILCLIFWSLCICCWFYFSLGHFFYTLYMDPMQACIKLKLNFVVRSFRFIFFMWCSLQGFFFFFFPAIESILKVYPNALTMF